MKHNFYYDEYRWQYVCSQCGLTEGEIEAEDACADAEEREPNYICK
jgi:hypothetical protein